MGEGCWSLRYLVCSFLNGPRPSATTHHRRHRKSGKLTKRGKDEKVKAVLKEGATSFIYSFIHIKGGDDFR